MILKLLQQLVIAILGGVIALTAFLYLGSDQVYEQEDGMQDKAQFVNNRTHIINQVSNLPSFSEPAKKATQVVVHIKAEESESSAQKNREERRKRFYGFDFTNPLEDLFRPDYRRKGTGSGVIISPNGYIVTNNHVVEYADYIEVTLNDGRRYTAEKIGNDPNSDLAVLRINADDLPTIEYADSETAKIGDWVLAIGNPFDYLTSTVTAGIISAKGRNLNLIEGKKTVESFIQTDAVVNRGNSGGALVDAEGRLLGINTAIATPTGVYAGYSFAIPVETVEKIVNDIFEYGEVNYVYFGAEITDNDSMLAKRLDLPYEDGAVIMSLDNGSPAQYAGLHPKDLITEVNGTKVASAQDLSRIINDLKAGDIIEVSIYRKSEKKQLKVRLKEG